MGYEFFFVLVKLVGYEFFSVYISKYSKFGFKTEFVLGNKRSQNVGKGKRNTYIYRHVYWP